MVAGTGSVDPGAWGSTKGFGTSAAAAGAAAAAAVAAWSVQTATTSPAHAPQPGTSTQHGVHFWDTLRARGRNAVAASPVGTRIEAFTRTRDWKTFQRTREFWGRAVAIYGSYKVCQLKAALVKSDAERLRLWEAQHQQAADAVYGLCIDLRGFYLKTGQFLAKPDLVPMAWVKRLSRLHDDAPQTPLWKVRSLLEVELGRRFEDIFERFDPKPVGSASVAQVHRARIRGMKTDVAVKVQHPDAQELMMMDIRNLKHLGAFLQRVELPFDLMSVFRELEEQIEYEFDFVREAASMKEIGGSLMEYQHEKDRARTRNSHVLTHRPLSKEERQDALPVVVPRPVDSYVTRRVLVMDFLEGTPIMRMREEMLKRGINPDSFLARGTKAKILAAITNAYGQMIIADGFFQADPHPGNFMILKGPKVGLIDYGQTKRLPEKTRVAFAKLVLAMTQGNMTAVAKKFESLGIVMERPVSGDLSKFGRMVCNMFDTKGQHVDPFDKKGPLQQNAVKKFPQDLFFVLRVTQLLRGLSTGMGIDWSSAAAWKPIAEKALAALEGNHQSNKLDEHRRTKRRLLSRSHHTRGGLPPRRRRSDGDLQFGLTASSLA
eukprot:jgi/Chlat1/1979/Chrsp158S02284